MKKIYLIFIGLTLLLNSSCDDYLDIVPDNVTTLDHAFSDKVSAERFLATIYSYMPKLGDCSYDPAIQASDEFVICESTWDAPSFANYPGNRIKSGLQNTNDPYYNFWEGRNGGRGLFIALRDCNIFLENIDKVGSDLYEEEREQWIAEVKFFKAFYHFYLLRMYGPIPLVRENAPISSSTEQIRMYREPFDDCVDYIVELLDEAIEILPLTVNNASTEYGRIIKPIAATLKADVLLTAASPLFNGNSDFAKLVDKRGVKLFNENYDASKWQKAADACKDAIAYCEEANIKLYTFDDNRYPLSKQTTQIMTIRNVMTKWNQEMIWANPQSTTNGYQTSTLPFLLQTHISGAATNPAYGVSFAMAELFYSKNGVPIEEDVDYDYDDRYKTTVVNDDWHYYYIKKGFETAVLNTKREPRFYANLGFDGGLWYGNGRYKDMGVGTSTEQPYVVTAKASEPSGKLSDIRYSKTGYYAKKPSHFESSFSTTGTLTLTRYTFPIYRLADLYLMYAEALNETLDTPNETVYAYVDSVRQRSGLEGVRESWTNYSKVPDKPSTKDGMREIIHHERGVELAFEGKRMWDLRRWKTAHILCNDYSKGWNVVGKTTADYYKIVYIEKNEFFTKNYLWPIRIREMRTNTNLVQNPLW